MKVNRISKKDYTWTKDGLNIVGRCDVDVYKGDHTAVIILHNHRYGPSVQNWVERLSANITKEECLKPGSFVVLERHLWTGPGNNLNWFLVLLKRSKKSPTGFDDSETRWVSLSEFMARVIIKVATRLKNPRSLHAFCALIPEMEPMEGDEGMVWPDHCPDEREDSQTTRRVIETVNLN